MSRLVTCGAELNFLGSNSPELVAGGAAGQATIQTLNPRTGSYAYRCVAPSGGDIATVGASGILAASTTFFGRACCYFVDLPSSTVAVVCYGTAGQIAAKLTSGGKLQLFVGGTQVGADSIETLLTGFYYVIELSVTINGASQSTAAELRLDGVSVASSTHSAATLGTDFLAGWIEAQTSKTMHIDDVAINDNQGSAQNSWPGDGKIVLLTPITDTQRGSWTGGAGGTTNVFDGVNNTPPIGTATETNLTQMESTDSSGNNTTDEFRGTTETYENASTQYENFDTAGSSTQPIGDGTIIYAAQTFKYRKSFSAVLLYLSKVGTPTDDVQIMLCTDDGGVPNLGTADILASSNLISCSTLTGTAAEYTFDISRIPLQRNSTYWIVIKRTGVANASNYPRTYYSSGDAYADGAAFKLIGSSWSLLGSPSLDLRMRFRERIGVTAPVRVIVPIANHGEDVSTNTKTGSFGLQANPVDPAYSTAFTNTFTFGNDGGALGTYPTGWVWTIGTPFYDPSITIATGTTLGARKTDSGTRVASIDSLAAYVEYQPHYATSDQAIISINIDVTNAGTIVASGNEITDASRALGVQGDGR